MGKWDEYVHADDIRKTIEILKPNNEPFEIRIISGTGSKPISGYFTDADTLLQKFDSVDLRGANVYITLNRINSACMSRIQHERFMQAKVTTSDTDITEYSWLFIDVDPVRASGVSSSREELVAAQKMARQIYLYLQGLGFENPVKALSGNGCHLLYKVYLKNTTENRELVQKCLQVLANIFDTEQVKIDTTNYNPARVCKLHGTLAQKGANTKERPHRFSRIFTDDLDVKITEKKYLEKLVAQLPENPQPERRSTYTPDTSFDLEDFLARHGLTYKKRQGDRAVIYSLDRCPFDDTHVDGDSKIFLYPNGAIAFKCHHNSCADKKWQDVRRKYEPEAYENAHTDIDNRIDEGWKKHNRNKPSGAVQPPTESTETVPPEALFRTMQQILADPEPQHEFVRCGIDAIDSSMGGLEKTGVSVISGLRGSGKSTWIGQIILSAVNDQHTVICYSGELDNHKYTNWLIRQAAGKTNVVKSNNFQNVYDVPQEIKQKIADWTGQYFWLYNNRYGNKFSEMEKFLENKIIQTRADICIIDNLMALDIGDYSPRDKYEAQTNFVWALKELAQITNTHIIFVAHPRKANGFLRLSDISGSGNIANIVDNAFIIHRWNKDFENGYQDYFKSDAATDIGSCTNVIEIAKDREGGLQDKFIPLWYEDSTKRLRNSPAENTVYGWQTDEDGFVPIGEGEYEPTFD